MRQTADLTAASFPAPDAAVPEAAPADVAERTEVIEQLGRHAVADPYRWLEDLDDPRSTRWLAAQRARFEGASGQWRHRDWFARRLGELTDFEECSLPAWRGSHAFYTCRMPDDEQACLRTRLYAPAGKPAGKPAGPERVILDPMSLDPTGATTLDAWAPSRDGRLVACQLSSGGTEQAVLHILDVATGEFTGSPIGGCRFSSVAWLPGRPAFYYVADALGSADAAEHTDVARPDVVRRAPQVRLHIVGTGGDTDRVVFTADAASELDIALDDSGELLLVTVMTDLSAATQIWVVRQPGESVQLVACRDGWTAAWPGRDGLLYLLTDDDAERGRIVVAGAAQAGTDPGRTLIAEDPAGVLEGFAVLDGSRLAAPVLVALRTHAGRSTLACHDLRTGQPVGEIALPGDGVIRDLACRDHGGHEIWFSYTDALTPVQIYRHDARTGATTSWRPPPATTGPRGVRATQVRYQSADGTWVRLLLTLPQQVTGPLPTIVQAYGAFGESQTADYYDLALAWAQAGGIFAIACVRGGGEEGEAWHHAGMLAGKQRGIDDLLAAAEHLVAIGLAAPDAIGVKGFSAGGLLAAAAFVQRPDLFAAAQCTSPLLDMARYELSGLGSTWTGEFGSRADPRELDFMLAYSPYHHVVAGTGYPAVLLVTFDGDTRVDPMHARKMCAALQHASSSGAPVLLRTEPGVGHGDRARSALLGYFADVLAFFAHHLMPGRPCSTTPSRSTRTATEPDRREVNRDDQEVKEALQHGRHRPGPLGA